MDGRCWPVDSPARAIRRAGRSANSGGVAPPWSSSPRLQAPPECLHRRTGQAGPVEPLLLTAEAVLLFRRPFRNGDLAQAAHPPGPAPARCRLPGIGLSPTSRATSNLHDQWNRHDDRLHVPTSGRLGSMRRWSWLLVAIVAVASCSAERDAPTAVRPTSPPPASSSSAPDSASTSPGGVDSSPVMSPESSAVTSGPSSSSTTSLVPTSAGATTVSGTAVAGASATVEPAGPPFTQTDPFSEAVRLADGTCVGWTDSRGGSTAGLAVGAPIAILIPDSSQQIGSGTITASRSVDIAGGAGQWNCFFDFTATLTTAGDGVRYQGRGPRALVGSAGPLNSRCLRGVRQHQCQRQPHT